MRLIYVAGAISRGDLVDNCRRAHDAGIALLKAGFAVVCPVGSCFWGNIIHRTNLLQHDEEGAVIGVAQAFVPEILPANTVTEDWYGMQLEIVRRCDAVLRLPGESTGADMEVAEAQRLGIPVYFTVQEVIAATTKVPAMPGCETLFGTMREAQFSADERTLVDGVKRRIEPVGERWRIVPTEDCNGQN